MKLPQGVGQVYKLKGTRRNPYIVIEANELLECYQWNDYR